MPRTLSVPGTRHGCGKPAWMYSSPAADRGLVSIPSGGRSRLSAPPPGPDPRRLPPSALLTRHGLAYGYDALLPPDRSGGTSLRAHPSHLPGRRPEYGRGYQAVRHPMPGGAKLATSRWSWRAIIPTCLAEIAILVPVRGARA